MSIVTEVFIQQKGFLGGENFMTVILREVTADHPM